MEPRSGIIIVRIRPAGRPPDHLNVKAEGKAPHLSLGVLRVTISCLEAKLCQFSKQEMELSKQEIELFKQEMELFLPLPGLWLKNLFYKMFLIFTKE